MTMCGTPNYISPEIVVRASHGLETDVWGLGIMLYTILVGKPPFDTDNRGMIMTLVVIKDIDFPGSLSEDAKDLIESLLQKKPENRIKLSQIMEHPFMSRSFYHYGIPPSSSCDSGMASSLPSSSRTRSLSDRILDNGDNILGPTAQPYPLLPNPAVQYSHQSVHRTSGYSNSNCFSTNSMSSNHGYPVPLRSASCDRRSVDTSHYGVIQNSIVHKSAEIPPVETSRQRFYSGSTLPSVSRTETNCSHAWKQCECGQCSHVETCGCIHERERHVSSNGFGSSCARSNGNYSNCVNVNVQQEQILRKPPTPIPEQKPAVLEKKLGLQPKTQIPHLHTTRIKPIRQKTKQVILHILDSGEACLEFIKLKNKSEKVFEVMRISSDGQRV